MRKSKRRNIKNIKNKKSKKVTLFLIVFFVLTFGFLAFIFFKVATLGKFIYVNNLNDASEIVVVDPKKTKIIRILIPGDTQLKASRGLGVYKIESLWKLSKKEGFDAGLVAESIRKTFLLPVYLWKNGTKTNLRLSQKIKVFFLDNKLSNYDVSKIDLIEKIPESISINFVETTLAEKIYKIEMEDLTGNIKSAEDVSKILGIMGATITSYSKGFDENLDCEVIGKDIELIAIVADTFGCKAMIDQSLSTDLKIRLGERFAGRF